MIDFLIYDLKVAGLIVVFYMFYRLLLSKETFHRVNRIVLLATAVASFILPLCVITMHKTVTLNAVPSVSVGDVQTDLATVASSVPLWQQAAVILYIIGVLAVLSYIVASVWKVVMLINRSEKHPLEDGITLCVTGNAALAPFSWMHYIVMNRSDYEQQDAAACVIRGTCCSLIPSPPSSGSTPPCGCCARTCAPSMSMRPTVQCSLKASMRVNTNTC